MVKEWLTCETPQTGAANDKLMGLYILNCSYREKYSNHAVKTILESVHIQPVHLSQLR